MSLDVYLTEWRETEVYERNVTHNLIPMADAAGIGDAIWRPEELGLVQAIELIPFLEARLERLLAEPDRYRQLNPPNGWGNYEGFCDFVAAYLEACRKNPGARVRVSR